MEESKAVVPNLANLGAIGKYTFLNGKQKDDYLSEKIAGKNFALQEAEGKISRTLHYQGIADLPILKTLFAILQKSQKACFW